MIRTGAFSRWAIWAVLALPGTLAAQVGVGYQPHYLASVQDAANQLRSLSPHFAPVAMQGDSWTLTNGFALARVDVSKEGVKLYFSRSPAQRIQYFWLWGKGATAAPYAPYTGDIVTSIEFANVDKFTILNFAQAGPNFPAPWCVLPELLKPGSNSVVCVSALAEAQGLEDALSTLVVASGGDLVPDDGLGPVSAIPAKYQHKHPQETGCEVDSLTEGGAPAQAGIKLGDIIHAVNGKPYVMGQSMIDNAIKEIALGKPEGVLHLDIYRDHNPMSIDVHYVKPQENMALLRKQGKELAEQSAAAAAADNAAPPPSGLKFGFQVRAVMDADVATYGLAKSKGIVVVQIEKGGLADAMGFKPDDVILEVNDSEIGDLPIFSAILQSGAVKKFQVWRKGKSLDLVMPQSM